jgi:flagellar hook-basal body complex protein FliE
MTPISSVTTASPSMAPLSASRVGHASDGAAFKDFLLGSLQEVNASQQQANALVERLYTGDDVNPAEVMVSVQKADMAFRLLLQIRNKLLAAYEEVKNIRV